MAQQHCEVNRWQLLKSQLNNILPKDFLAAAAATEKAILVDVRTPEEYEFYHLPGAIHLDYLGPDFIDELEQMDADAHYFVYCRSGRRSVRACTLMRNGGFTHIYNLDGGLALWEQEGVALPD